MEKKYYAILLILVVAGISLFYFYTTSDKTGSKNETTYEAILDRDDNFAMGEKMRLEGKYPEAIASYQKALVDSKDKVEEGLINYQIAVVTKRFSYSDSIPKFKAIIANEQYTPIQRAYAVQSLGELFYSSTGADLTGQIFTGSPYSDFIKSRDRGLAYRKLFEYAVSFYPLAISNLRVAQWYANEISQLHSANPIANENQSKIAPYTAIVGESLRLADADILRTKNTNDEYVSIALIRKADVLSTMWRAGNKSFGDPEQAYKDSISANGTVGENSYATARFNYAIFLADTYGKSRKQDITNLLKPVYQNLDKYPHYKTVLINSRENIQGNKNDFVTLALIDNDFYNVLISLGWSKSDIK